jgi:hypothetical protein
MAGTPGDKDDMLARLKSVLPARWLAEASTTADAVLAGLAEGWAWLHGMVETLRAQARIATASGAMLDMIAADFFGPRLARRRAQGDAAFRAAIRRELLRERATRPALQAALRDLTGREALVFEPRRPADTGGWGIGAGYGTGGGWGSLALPYQMFVTARRPQGSGIAGLDGWAGGLGGWGGGRIAWASLAQLEGQVTDADIAAATAAVLPQGATAWLRIED